MKKFQSILAFGDSIVAGCEAVPELEIYYQQVASSKLDMAAVDSLSKPYSFANLLAGKLGIPCHNFAMSGGSNARSLRLLTREILNYPDSLVLFGYTCTDRKEFYYPDEGFFYARDQDNFIQTGMQWEILSEEFDSINPHPINKLYVQRFLRPYNDLKEIMFCVESISKIHAAGLIHLPLFPENIPNDLENIFNFEGSKNYYNWAESKGFTYTKRFHHDRRAHEMLSSLLLKYLFINYQEKENL